MGLVWGVFVFRDFVGDFVGTDLRSALTGLTGGRRVVITVAKVEREHIGVQHGIFDALCTYGHEISPLTFLWPNLHDELRVTYAWLHPLSCQCLTTTRWTTLQLLNPLHDYSFEAKVDR